MDNSDTAQPNADELTTELSESEELAYVDKILGKQPTVKTDFNGSKLSQPKESEVAQEEDANQETEETQEEESAPVADEAKTTEEVMEAEPISEPDFSDLWAEVEAFELDDEGNPVTKTFRITADGMPDEMRFKSDKQLAEVLDTIREMKDIQAERQAEYEEAVAEREEQAAATAAEQEQLQSWDDEIATLIDNGILDAPKAKPGEAAWATDPTVKTLDDVFTFMKQENDKLIAEGKRPIRSFTSYYTLFTKQSAKSEAEAKAKQEAELIKKRGAMVGGGAASSSSTKPKLYKAGSAKSIWAVDTSDL